MEDTPGVRTRLQSKLITPSGNSSRQSAQNSTKVSLGSERGLRETRQSTQPKKVNETTVSNSKQNENSCRVSLNKIDSSKNEPKTLRRNGEGQSSGSSVEKSMPSSSDALYSPVRRLTLSSITSDEKAMPSPNTRSRSALKFKLSLTENRRNTRSSSANKQLFPHKKEMSLLESDSSRKSASKKFVSKSPQKRKVSSSTSHSEDNEIKVSPPKKGSTFSRNTSSSETSTPRNDDAVQEDAKMSVESSGEKHVLNRPNNRDKYSSDSGDSDKGSYKNQKITSSLQTKNSGRKRSTNKPSPRKKRLSCTCLSVKDIVEVSPHEKHSVFSNSVEAENFTSKKDDNAVQEDINKSLGSLEEKTASTKVLEINNTFNVSDDVTLGGTEEKEQLRELCTLSASSEHQKSLRISVEPTCKDGRNSPLVSNSLHYSALFNASSPSIVGKSDVCASHRLSPDKTYVGNTTSVKFTPRNKTSLTEMCTYEDSSADTFEEISETVPVKNEISLNSQHKTFDLPKNLVNEDNSKRSSNQEIVLLDDVSSDENPVVELNHSSTLPHNTFAQDIKVTEENKLCSDNGHKRHCSFEDEIGVQNPLSSKKNSYHSTTNDGKNPSPYKSPFSTSFSKSNNADNLGEDNTRENVPDESSHCYSKETIIAQVASQSPKSPKELVAPVLTASSDKRLATDCSKQCIELSDLDLGSSDEYELSTSIPNDNDKHLQKGNQNEQKENGREIIQDLQKGNQNEQKENGREIIQDEDGGDSTFHVEVARTVNGKKLVVPKEAKVTNLITLDSDESSEFCVTEVESLQVEQSGQETIDENIDDEEIIEVRGVVNEAGNESTEDEVGMNESEDDDIEVIEDMINSEEISGEKLRNKGAKEGSVNIDGIISSQRKVVSGQNLFKESILENKGLIRKPAFAKVSKNLFSGNTSQTDVFAFFNEEISMHKQSEDYGTIKSSKLSRAPAVSTTRYLDSAVSNYKSKNLGSKNISSLNMSSDVKCKEDIKMQVSANLSEHLAKKLKKKSVIAASKVLNANLDMSSSDVEEIVDSNAVSGKNEKMLKECLKSSSVGAKSHIQRKHVLVRTKSKNVNEILESDSDAESRKDICQKIKMRIAESVAVSAGSNCKKESDDHIEDSVSPPRNVSFSAGCRSTIEPQARTIDTKQQPKQLSKIQRRKRLEMLKQQKEEKLNKLKECMASKEDASCSSSESSADEWEKRDSKSYRCYGFVVSSTNKGTKQERQPLGLHHAVRKKRKMKCPSIKVADSTKPKCKATTEWIVEDFSKNSSKLRRLPEAVLDQLDNHQPRRLPNSGNIVSKGGQKHTKRKHWKETGCSVNGFHVATDADFIPVETGTTVQFGVMPLDKMAKAAPANAKASANFRHSMLYGSRVRREPAKSLLDRQLKLKAGRKDGLVRPFHF